MSIPDIVLEDLYRRIRELEEAVRKLQQANTVYRPVGPPPVPFPPVVTLPYHPGPAPVWSGGVQLCDVPAPPIEYAKRECPPPPPTPPAPPTVVKSRVAI